MGFHVQGQTNKHILGNRLQRKLRNNMTEAEKKIWAVLRRKQFQGYKFRRQHPFDQYILDFVCLEKKLIVEIDGGQHLELCSLDEERTNYLEKAGFKVLRFWNHEVLTKIEAVKEVIWTALEDV